MVDSIKGDLKEIAALVITVQERHPIEQADSICISGSIPKDKINIQIAQKEQ